MGAPLQSPSSEAPGPTFGPGALCFKRLRNCLHSLELVLLVTRAWGAHHRKF